MEHTYEVKAYDRENQLIVDTYLDVPTSQVQYINENSWSYPTTSYVAVDGQKQLVQTDRERFWRYYVQEVLPTIHEQLDLDEQSGMTKPLFHSLTLDVTMSEAETKLDFEHERISSMEALHEDLYFNTLEYYRELGLQKKVGLLGIHRVRCCLLCMSLKEVNRKPILQLLVGKTFKHRLVDLFNRCFF